MSAMGAIVVVLKFLHVDDHWNSRATYITTPTTNRTTRPAQLSSAFLSFHMNKLLALNLYMKSASTSRAESEKLRFKSTVSVDPTRIRPVGAGSQDEMGHEMMSLRLFLRSHPKTDICSKLQQSIHFLCLESI